MSIRDSIIQVATDAVGKCGCAPFRADFLRWLGPCEPGWRYPLELPYNPSAPAGRRGMSLCSRTTEIIWQRAGVAVPSDWPVFDGKTFVRTHTWPESVNATYYPQWVLPNEGDAIWTESHFIAVVVECHQPWDINLKYQDFDTVEGGAICLCDDPGHEKRGLQRINRKTRRIFPGKPAYIAEVQEDGSIGHKSEILGCVNVDLLPTT